MTVLQTTFRRWGGGFLLSLPAIFWLFFFFLMPLVIVFVVSFLSRGQGGVGHFPLTLEHYDRVFGVFSPVLWRSLWIAFLSTVICFIVGYPLAFFISTRQSARMRNLTLFMVILPFWTNFLIRTYAWRVLLGTRGTINEVLINAGIIQEPLQLLNTEFAVLLGLIYGFLPFMVLPIYASIERFDFKLVDAAHDLGANDLKAFLRVVFPLTLPGVFAGCALVFIPAVGSYVTPDLLGGTRGVMIGNLIQRQFGGTGNMPLGSAMSIVLMAVVMLALLVYVRLGSDSNEGEGLTRGAIFRIIIMLVRIGLGLVVIGNAPSALFTIAGLIAVVSGGIGLIRPGALELSQLLSLGTGLLIWVGVLLAPTGVRAVGLPLFLTSAYWILSGLLWQDGQSWYIQTRQIITQSIASVFAIFKRGLGEVRQTLSNPNVWTLSVGIVLLTFAPNVLFTVTAAVAIVSGVVGIFAPQYQRPARLLSLAAGLMIWVALVFSLQGSALQGRSFLAALFALQEFAWTMIGISIVLIIRGLIPEDPIRRDMRMRRAGKWGLYFNPVFSYIFLWVPILVLVLFSFNESRSVATWTGFTFQWYENIFNDIVGADPSFSTSLMLETFRNSLFVSFTATIISTIIGTMVSLSLARSNFPGKRFLENVMFLPVVIPEITQGISLAIFFNVIFGWWANISGNQIFPGFHTIIIAHVAFNISYVAIVVQARLADMNPSYEEAARDLGANYWKTFRHVTLPLILPGIIAGALLAFTLSLDDYVITFFTSGVGTTTLPIFVYGLLKLTVTPEINAISTLMLILSTLLIGVSLVLQGRNAFQG